MVNVVPPSLFRREKKQQQQQRQQDGTALEAWNTVQPA